MSCISASSRTGRNFRIVKSRIYREPLMNKFKQNLSEILQEDSKELTVNELSGNLKTKNDKITGLSREGDCEPTKRKNCNESTDKDSNKHTDDIDQKPQQCNSSCSKSVNKTSSSVSSTCEERGAKFRSNQTTKSRRKGESSKKSIPKTEEKQKKQEKITNLFPIRKSSRKTKSQQEIEKNASITEAILSKKSDGLEANTCLVNFLNSSPLNNQCYCHSQVREIQNKGRGIFATRDFVQNEYVCEYSGELITYEEAKKREVKYRKDKNIGCYMYYLECKNKKFCVDATEENGTLGRLLNHSRTGNCKTKVHVINEIPHLIFLTMCEVKKGEEMTYDYGERSKDVIETYPWLKY